MKSFFLFFFQAEDGIRDGHVTGVQTCALPIVPLLVIFADRIYHDGIDLGPREFYERLETGSASPRTNPPPRSDFLKVYRESAARQDLFSLHLSEKLSQTVANARAVAAEALPALAALRSPAVGRPFAIEVAD